MTRVRKFQVPNYFGERAGEMTGGRSISLARVSLPAEPRHEDEPEEPKRKAAPLRRGASHTFRQPKERYGKAGG